MDLLKAEISRKRKATEDLKAFKSSHRDGSDGYDGCGYGTNRGDAGSPSSDAVPITSLRFIRQRDVMDQERNVLRQADAQRQTDAKRDSSNLQSSLTKFNQSHTSVSKQTGSTDGCKSEKELTVDEITPRASCGTISLSVDEVKRRLRLLKLPVTLFGETDEDRYVRLTEGIAKRDMDDDDDEMRNDKR